MEQPAQTAPAKAPAKDIFALISQLLNGQTAEQAGGAGEQAVAISPKGFLETMREEKEGPQKKGTKDEKTGTEDSRCCDSMREIHMSGVVGILEGFGLLDQVRNQNRLPEGQEGIAVLPADETVIPMGSGREASDTPRMAIEAETPLAEAEELVFGQSARMPLAQPDAQPFEARIQADITGEKDLCSFENANNRGIREEKAAEPEPAAGPLDTAGQASAGWKKLAGMLEEAMGRKDSAQPLVPRETEDISPDVLPREGIAMDTHKVTGQSRTVTPEDGAAAQAERPAVTSSQMEENLSRIVEKLSTRSRGNMQEFEVTLKPEQLGHLRIHLAMDEAGIKACIRTKDAAVGGLIQEQASQLQDMLREKGINVTSMEVTHENFLQNQGDRQPQNRNWQSENQSRKAVGIRGMEAFSSAEAYEIPDISPQMRGNLYSSVEFRA